MERIQNSIATTLLCFGLAACISPKSFVDPSVPKASYEDLKKRSDPLKLKLSVEFQRNGEHFPKADTTLKDNTERILRGTGVIAPVDAQAVGEVNVIVNNIVDRGSAAAKGLGTGLTFGLVGSTVMDAYEMTISITANGKTVTRTAVKHTLYTAIGNTSLPPGVEVVPASVAFVRILENMLLRALADMQASGELTLAPDPDLRWWQRVMPG